MSEGTPFFRTLADRGKQPVSGGFIGDQDLAAEIRGRKILFVANTAFFVRNFLMAFVHGLARAGCDVRIVCPEDRDADLIREAGFKVIRLKNLSRKGINPFQDARLLLELAGIYRREAPDLAVHFTVKPNIYGSLACRLAGVESIATITGLGFLFMKTGVLNLVARGLYAVALRCCRKVGFLNADDRDEFSAGGLVRPGQTFLLPGTGIDARQFAPVRGGEEERARQEGLVFLMCGRVLWDKGVGEFVSAAKRVRQAGHRSEFWILGAMDAGNPSAVPESFLKENEREGTIRYLEQVADVRAYIGRSDVVVLPSYREGIPRALLEAMAMEKPIIAADSTGCRDVIEEGRNGFLAPVRDAEALAQAMIRMIAMDEGGRRQFGREGRNKVLREFDDRVVTGIFIREVTDVLEPAGEGGKFHG